MTKTSEKYGYDSTFPTRFRNLLDFNKVTQQKMAEICSVKPQSVSQWRNGETRPDILSLTKIAQHFNVSTDYLLGLTDIKSTDKATRELCETLGFSENVVNFLLHSKSSTLYNEFKERFKIGDVHVEDPAWYISCLAEDVTMCLDRLINEYISSFIDKSEQGSLLENLMAFYSSLYAEDAELYDENDVSEDDEKNKKIKTMTNRSKLVFLFGNYSTSVKMQELLIDAQILEISATLNELKRNALKERKNNET